MIHALEVAFWFLICGGMAYKFWCKVRRKG